MHTRALAALLVAILPPAARAQPEPPPPRSTPAPATTDILFDFPAVDGTPLHAKLSLPSGAKETAPVVFYLHGASPRTYDVPIPYRDADGSIKMQNYLDFYSAQLAQRGVAFCRMSKRGCTPSAEPPGMTVERAVFSKATISVLLSDYEQGLKAMRARADIDPARVILLGTSEGTRLAPQLALCAPEGVIGVVMMAYAADNAKGTVEWQNSVGPWRNVQHLVPAARDGELTRAEYDEALKATPSLSARLPFDPIDVNKDDVVKSEDMVQLVRPRLDAIVKAMNDGDDDFLWTNLLNLSSAYLLEWWDAAPNQETLLKLDIPLGIFHGDLDGACRVEGVHETRDAFKTAGKTNLTTTTYPGADHDLNWKRTTAAEGGPRAFRDAFDLIERWTRPAGDKPAP